MARGSRAGIFLVAVAVAAAALLFPIARADAHTSALAADASPSELRQAAKPKHGDHKRSRTLLLPAPGKKIKRNAWNADFAASVPADEPGRPVVNYVQPIPANCGATGSKRYRVIYAHFRDTPNRFAALENEIRWSVAANNGLLAQNSRQGPRPDWYFRQSRLRVNCHGGAMSIESMWVDHGMPTFFENVERAIRTQIGPLDPSNVHRYLVYMDARSGDGLCGQGQIFPHEIGNSTNRNNVMGGQIAVVYREPIYTGDTCWVTDTPLHEVLHTMGAVQPTAPYATAGWHCRDGHDVMCYNDGSAGSTPQTYGCGWNAVDCGRDSYLSTAPPAGSAWLNASWNVADTRMNHWIDLGDSVNNSWIELPFG